jgi:hypothetical protein
MDALAGHRADLLLRTGGRTSLNKVAAVAFSRRQDEPLGVLKAPRVEEAEAALRHEASVLKAVHHRYGELPGIPRVLNAARMGPTFAVELSFVAGAQFSQSLTPQNHELVALGVTDLLAKLVRRGDVVPVDAAASVHLRTARSELGAAELSRLEALVTGLPVVPRACEHRDCSPWNLHRDGRGRLGLLDWESAQIDGLPLMDVLYYVAQATMLLAAPGSERLAYAEMLQPGTPAERTLARCIERYVLLTGLDPRAIGPLRVLCWLAHLPAARRRHADGRADGSTHPDLFLALVKQELARL